MSTDWPDTLWLRELQRSLETELEAESRDELDRALKCAVLLAAGLKQTEVARQLGVDIKRVHHSVELLRTASPK